VSEDNQFFDVGRRSFHSARGATASAGRFSDLRSAGCDLAKALEQFRARKEVIVLGLILGGVPVASEVADRLGLPLDFVLIRRLLAPSGPDSQVCAVNVAGSLVLDQELPPRRAAPESAFDYFLSEALDNLADRERVCRGGRPPVELEQKTLLLVDCGIRTGSTMRAAIRALRKKAPARIIAAVPVTSAEGRTAIEAVADNLICLASPEPFGHVGLWYKDFSRPDDHQIGELLDQPSSFAV
jgi:putative phosphoribosyl transferase